VVKPFIKVNRKGSSHCWQARISSGETQASLSSSPHFTPQINTAIQISYYRAKVRSTKALPTLYGIVWFWRNGTPTVLHTHFHLFSL